MSRKPLIRKKPDGTRSISSLVRAPMLLLPLLLLPLLILAVAALNGLFNRIPEIDYSLPDRTVSYPIQGAEHIAQGEAHPAYNSNPPTSGWHYTQPADWGIYRESFPDEVLIHNLEHSGIWISYRDAENEETIRQLEDIVRRYPSQVILTYRPENPSPIAVAAWGRLLEQESVDSAQIYNFIARYRGKAGPENVS